MDNFTLLAASGLKARLESLEMLANNLANVSTPGFKMDREFFNTFITEAALAGLTYDPATWPGVMPVIRGQFIDFQQGELQATGNPFDLAISGPGFFVVEGPQGRFYTRNGHFSLSADGTLVTAEGYPVLLENGNPINIPPGAELAVAQDGTVSVNGLQQGRLLIVDFSDRSVLTKAGYSYLRAVDPNIQGEEVVNPKVHQGMLESSNVNPALAAVRLIEVLRQFEMLQRAMLAEKDVSRRAIQELSRPE